MKVLWSWLLELCDLDNVPSVDEGAKALTRGGLEIEGMTDLGAGFSGVVVCEVVGKRPHPQADKLTLVDVITERNGTATQVVCGAPNVPEPGRRVLWAQIGARLPNGPERSEAGERRRAWTTLSAKPVKGIDSPGMLCAEDELGMSEDHAGIIVLPADDLTPLGSPAQRALGLDDWMLEINAPANRGDVLGHLGVARELVAILRGRLVPPDTDLSAHVSGETPRLDLDITAGCPRYVARVIDGVTVGPSPRRIAARLRGVGLRSISNLVDITNYVMFELGQPQHAFDAAKLATSVIGVGRAHDGEKLVTLDGIDRTLVKDDLVIRDGKRAIALAGVMGGRETEVTAGTTRILLESATFDPKAVRKTARRLNLHSEASHRFERGVDRELAGLASARAARLICQLAGGTVQGESIDAYPERHAPVSIPVRMARVRMLTGVALPASTARDALARLGCAVTGTDEVLEVTPPSARADVAREVDVIEEVLRIVGYEQVPSTLPILREAPGVRPPDIAMAAREALCAAGASEAITFAFQSVERANALGLAPTDRRAQPIAVRNPMSIDQAVMRTSLMPNLIAAVARNASHGRPDVALFEVGTVFLRRGEAVSEQPLHELADEPTWAAAVLSGRRPGHIGDGAPWDVHDAKALARAAIRAVAGPIDVTTRATRDVAYLHPGVAGELLVDRDIIGWFGEVHPRVRRALGVETAVFAFDLQLDKLRPARPAQMQPIPRFPGSTRDVSLLLADTIPAARIAEVIEHADEALVSGVRLLEDYRDAKLPAGTKSMLWSIAYRAPDRTLTDVEVDKAHETIVGRLVDNLPAQRR